MTAPAPVWVIDGQYHHTGRGLQGHTRCGVATRTGMLIGRGTADPAVRDAVACQAPKCFGGGT